VAADLVHVVIVIRSPRSSVEELELADETEAGRMRIVAASEARIFSSTEASTVKAGSRSTAGAAAGAGAGACRAGAGAAAAVARGGREQKTQEVGL
jgi:hypothetical protein